MKYDIYVLYESFSAELNTVKIDAQEVGNPKCPRAPPHCNG